MSAISTYPYFSSSKTTASRAGNTGTGPSQGGVLSHTVTNRKNHTYYYGVQSAVFTPSTQKANASGAYTSSRQVCITAPTITTATASNGSKNSKTGSIKTYGTLAAYTNRPWESSSKSTVSSSVTRVSSGSSSTRTTYSAVCVTCR